ncbi:PAS domain S-box [Desulfosporosinus orientis DSM 765]|uniref:HTH-type transcriptional regulatory protein TyrR n=1 Tax=Desulfosporosinus orientis (strain ATCC 19365 / DSM 765 / NCIMB 8382 / VKM B-1628 / Singapore I) TaxID=768706 RepID=G7WHT5_DESOD|nr:sigma-54-dependent Fis family transcriptional regulator [Desulfosporosinus orientis]AET69647.1 PAS domain S-box [Desulfosporosinus orientis DSM 765]
MKVREIMTSDPLTISPNHKVCEVVNIFIANKIDGAPVLDENGKLVGLFTKSHIYRAISRGLDMNTKVEALMTRKILTGHPEDEFGDVVNATVPRLPVVNENGRVVGIITRGDIAKAFFNSYRNMSLELDTIINSTHNAIISVDEKGIIKVWNLSAAKLLGIEAEDVAGKNILDVLPTTKLMDVIQTGKVETFMKVKLNDRYFMSNRSPIKKDGKIIGAVAVLQDISELDKMSKELCYVKELNEELDAIVESSFDGLFITDGKGYILRYNKAFEQLTGIDAHEYLGLSVEDIRRDGIISEPVTCHVLEKKKSITIMQTSKTGKLTLTTGNPVIDARGEIIRVVCNVRDITELNLLKHKLKKAQGLSQHYENQLRTLKMRYDNSENLVVSSAKMRHLLDMVIRLASVDSTILITGESGTGKELIAETIHSNSSRRDKPFIKVNCGAIPENLLESELFGYNGGAFTGAKKEGKSGYIELASGGTLFLDEIGEMPLNLQVKVLRFLQNKEIIRVGGSSVINVDVRIVAATNRVLLEMVQQKQFREDLYYRLNVVPVHVPPLRDRKDDIPPLAAHFLEVFNYKYKKNKKISQAVVDILMQYDWPGNIRELENLIERMVVTTIDDNIAGEDLPSYLRDKVGISSSYIIVSGIVPLRDAVESVEKQLLERAYANYRTTRQMAKELKVDASTVVRKAAKYCIIRDS